MSDSVTDRQPSDPSVDLLRHVESLIDRQADATRALTATLEASIKTLYDKIESGAQHHDREHQLIALAIEKAEAVMLAYKAESNEWRGALKDFVSESPTQKDLDGLRTELVQARESWTVQQRQTQSEWMVWRKTIEDRLAAADVVAGRFAGERSIVDAIPWIIGVVGGAAALYALLNK